MVKVMIQSTKIKAIANTAIKDKAGDKQLEYEAIRLARESEKTNQNDRVREYHGDPHHQTTNDHRTI